MGYWFWMLVVALLVAGVGAGWWARRRRHGLSAGSAAGGAALQGAGGGPVLPTYSPKNVGNDASARPWEQQVEPELSAPAHPDTAPAGAPPGFDTQAFLATSKTNFIRLQDAWDRADIPALRAMMTDEMTEQIRVQLVERESHTGASANQTEVVMLEAQLLGLEELADAYLASVEFSGMIREDPSAGANPFREVWNITRPKAGHGGWLVAGVQALQ